MRVVVTCTTLPDRYHLLVKMLESLHAQTIKPNQIYLTLPYTAKRLNKEYGPLPSTLPVCKVVRTKVDYGPMTKLYGALLHEQDPNTLIITVDDDIVYPPNFIEIFLAKHLLKPNACITGTGVLIGHGVNLFAINTTIEGLSAFNFMIGFNIKNYRRVDIVQGFSGVLYKRCFFPTVKKLNKLFDLPLSDIDLFKSDDVVLSGLLCSQNIKRITFNGMPQVKMVVSDDALAADPLKMLKTFNNALTKMKSYFIKFEQLEVMESPVIKTPLFIFVVLVFLIIIFTLIYLFYRYNINDKLII